jgi:hypothetical protein
MSDIDEITERMKRFPQIIQKMLSLQVKAAGILTVLVAVIFGKHAGANLLCHLFLTEKFGDTIKKNNEIAVILGLNEKTISTYKLRLLQKLNVTNLVDLVNKAKTLEIV